VAWQKPKQVPAVSPAFLGSVSPADPTWLAAFPDAHRLSEHHFCPGATAYRRRPPGPQVHL